LRYLFIAAISATGVGLAVQAAANARMGAVVQAPTLSALINFAVGGIALGLLAASGVFGRGTLANVGAAPWWAWIGGIFGASWVLIAVIAVPKVGAALTVAAVIFGQLVGTLLLDTFGWLGVPRIPLNPWRVTGAVLLFVGVLMMQHK
jgi:bacterial/archaeal transporter family-2 protein